MLKLPPRRGQALLEFALIALVLYLLLAGTLTFGLLFWSGSVIQQAVSTGAQEIARMPLPATGSLGLGNLERPGDTVMDLPQFRDEIYDESMLVIKVSDVAASGLSFAQYANEHLPLINRLLSQVYIFDASYDPDGSGGVYRYPGAIVQHGGEDTILIPIVRSASNVEWIAPVEESLGSSNVGTFSVVRGGTVALRINYPYQSAVMSSFEDADSGESNVDKVISADDSRLSDGSLGRYTLRIDHNAYMSDATNIHGGRFGMGRQFALPSERVGRFGVRPFRKVISAQAIYRREAFGP